MPRRAASAHRHDPVQDPYNVAIAPSFPELLRRLRRQAHLTQEELAEKAGYSPDYVSMLERGLRVAPPLTVEILAKALKLEAAERASLLEAGGAVAPVPQASAPPAPVLVGRDDDVGTALGLLRDARIVTLVGPGGVGKSRLAQLVAARAAPSFADGSVFVDLSSVPDAGVVPAIAAALGLGGDSFADVAARVRSRELLLVLDGFEHFLPSATDVAKLLAASSKLKILVTSRVALRLDAERELPVRPLAVPPGGSDPREIFAAPAVALFLRRAQATDPRFECTPEQAGTIAAICARVDGLPLAIELAAARLKHLPLSALAENLKLGLLSGGARDWPKRHQSMRDTIAWSYELLGAEEKARFRQLSVFVGGFTLDAAEAVCEGDEVLSVIASLVDKSLVVVDRDSSEPRYRLLDTLREFSAERLEAEGELGPIRRRHAAYFTRFAEASEAGLQGRAQRGWYRRIEAEQGNLRAAAQHLLASRDVEGVIRLAASVWLFWQSHGDYEAGKWVEGALALGGSVKDPLRAKGTWVAAWLAFRRGELARATELQAELRAHAEKTGDALAARNALTVAGHVAMARGEIDEAIASFEQGVALCRPLGVTWPLAMSCLNLGIALLHARRLVEASRHLEEARALHLTLGDAIFEARCLAYLGYVALFSEQLERAEHLFSESERACEEHADQAGVAEARAGLAAVRAAQGRDVEARQLAEASEAIRIRSGWRPLPSDRAAWMRYLDRTR